MEVKSFVIGILFSYFAGMIVSTINYLTEKALLNRTFRKQINKPKGDK